jgi:hypothetical protein
MNEQTMIGRVVSLLIVVIAASVGFAESASPAEEFYLGVPHDKKSAQVQITESWTRLPDTARSRP